MAIENFNEVVEYISSNESNEEVANYIKGFKTYDLDGVKNFLESNDNGKAYLQSYADSRVTKGIETFKSNQLNKIVEEEIKKRNPSLDPKDIEIQELKRQFEQIQKEASRKELTNKALKHVTEKGLDYSNVLDFFIADDEESTFSNLGKLEETLNSIIEKRVEQEIAKKFDNNIHIPQNPKNDIGGLITQEEWNKNKNNVDWFDKNKSKIYESRKQGLIK